MANTYSLDLEKGSSQYAYKTDTASLSIVGDISIECWVKFEQLPSESGAMVLVSKWNGTTGNSYQLSLNTDDTLHFYYSADGGNTNITYFITNSAAVASAGVWYHIAVAVNPAVPSAVFYVNGSVVANTKTGTQTAIYNSTTDFNIGCNLATTTPQNFLDGLIDEVRVWSSIRSAEELANNRNKELTGSESDLEGYWKFNNGYLDETANNNDLTASGSPVFSTSVPFSDAGFFALL